MFLKDTTNGIPFRLSQTIESHLFFSNPPASIRMPVITANEIVPIILADEHISYIEKPKARTYYQSSERMSNYFIKLHSPPTMLIKVQPTDYYPMGRFPVRRKVQRPF